MTAFKPSAAPAYIFCAVNLGLCLVFLFQIVRRREWYALALPIGCLGKCIHYNVLCVPFGTPLAAVLTHFLLFDLWITVQAIGYINKVRFHSNPTFGLYFSGDLFVQIAPVAYLAFSTWFRPLGSLCHTPPLCQIFRFPLVRPLVDFCLHCIYRLHSPRPHRPRSRVRPKHHQNQATSRRNLATLVKDALCLERCRHPSRPGSWWSDEDFRQCCHLGSLYRPCWNRPPAFLLYHLYKSPPKVSEVLRQPRARRDRGWRKCHQPLPSSLVQLRIHRCKFIARLSIQKA